MGTSRSVKSAAKSLVVVESPAKARTLNKFLGSRYQVKASMGHIRDLPVKSLAVDIKKNFQPQYVIIKGREKVVADLKKAAAGAAAVYLAADPDREGEAICWHLAQELVPITKKKTPLHRVTFHEITRRAVQEAFAHPGSIDPHKVDAQQTRRILDRLVGYQISPLLWEKVRRGISAGRVQSVALRLIVDREREIRAFVPREYWTVEAALQGETPPGFTAWLVTIGGEKAALRTGEETGRIVEEVRRETFRVSDVVRKEKRRNPVAPFTTSKLQQEAVRKLHFTAKKTMQIAQQLYEGIEIGEEGPVGLITYMRTDSPRISAEAQEEAARYIRERFGEEYLPDRPPVYKSRKSAQEAHEAIRPTSVVREPSALRNYLTKDQMALYTLIWNRLVASQMRPALFDVTTVEISAGRFGLRATGRVLRFDGFTRLYVEGSDEAAARHREVSPPAPAQEGSAEEEAVGDEAEQITLPPLAVGEVLALQGITPEQHFTEPPPLYTEASLVKELEEKGIGRPSTYATILSVIQNRDYVVKEKGRFTPTELGEVVVDLLVESFPQIMDYAFTARMEETLDEIEEGRTKWLPEMKRFYHAFSRWLKEAKAGMTNMKALTEKTEETCEKCGSPMVIKWGRFGRFLACSRYPECKSTRELNGVAGGNGNNGAGGLPEGAPERCEKCGKPMVMKKGRFGPFLACSGYPECKTVVKITAGQRTSAPPEPTGESCEKCGSPMVIREGRYGRFISCSAYPKCRNIKSIPLGVSCPQCRAPLTARRTKRGRTFYGCSRYPECTFALWDRPVAEACPTCGAAFLTERRSRGKPPELKCIVPGCKYSREMATV